MPRYFQGSKGAQVRVMGRAVLLFDPQIPRPRGGLTGAPFGGGGGYFIGSEEVVSLNSD